MTSLSNTDSIFFLPRTSRTSDLKSAFHDPWLYNRDLPMHIPDPAYQVNKSPPLPPSYFSSEAFLTPRPSSQHPSQQVPLHHDTTSPASHGDGRLTLKKPTPELPLLPDGRQFSPQSPYLQNADFSNPQFPSHDGHPDRSVHKPRSRSHVQNSPRDQQFVPYPTSPVDSHMPKGLQHSYDGPYHGFHSDDDDDVFGPGLQPAPVGPASLPRHSSLKPSQQQTYLTGEKDAPVFSLNDISSVLDSPKQNVSSHPLQNVSQHYSPRQPSTQESFRSPPLGHPGVRRQEGRSPQQEKPLAQVWPSPKPADESESSTSSGRQLGYTRDQLHNTVDRVRHTSRLPLVGPEQYLDVTAQGLPPDSGSYRDKAVARGVPGAPGAGRPGAGYDLGAYGAPVKPARLHPVAVGRYPEDSQSSGIGSRNTSQSTNSLQRPRSKPSAASTSSLFTPQESFQDDDYLHDNLDRSSLRRDTSADENYEFDSLPALESDLLSDLRRYSRLSTAGGDSLGVQQGDVVQDLYPKPRHPSQYADAAERFERLREEFHQYRKQQSTSLSPSYYEQQPSYPMDSEML